MLGKQDLEGEKKKNFSVQVSPSAMSASCAWLFLANQIPLEQPTRDFFPYVIPVAVCKSGKNLKFFEIFENL